MKQQTTYNITNDLIIEAKCRCKRVHTLINVGGNGSWGTEVLTVTYNIRSLLCIVIGSNLLPEQAIPVEAVPVVERPRRDVHGLSTRTWSLLALHGGRVRATSPDGTVRIPPR